MVAETKEGIEVVFGFAVGMTVVRVAAVVVAVVGLVGIGVVGAGEVWAVNKRVVAGLVVGGRIVGQGVVEFEVKSEGAGFVVEVDAKLYGFEKDRGKMTMKECVGRNTKSCSVVKAKVNTMLEVVGTVKGAGRVEVRKSEMRGGAIAEPGLWSDMSRIAVGIQRDVERTVVGKRGRRRIESYVARTDSAVPCCTTVEIGVSAYSCHEGVRALDNHLQSIAIADRWVERFVQCKLAVGRVQPKLEGTSTAVARLVPRVSGHTI